MKTYIIYRHTLNNKDYIGYSSQTIQKRLEEHLVESKNGSDRHFHRAIRKYGSENIVSEVLDTATTRKEARQKERQYITIYDTFRNGYNMTSGGDGGNTKEKYTENEMKEWGKVRSELSSGMNNGNSRPDITVDKLIDLVCQYIIIGDRFNKNITRKEIDSFLKDNLNVSSRIVINRVKSYSMLVNLVNTALIEKKLMPVKYDPYYRSEEEKSILSKKASEYCWVTNGTTSKQVKKNDLDKYLTENSTYKKGRTV